MPKFRNKPKPYTPIVVEARQWRGAWSGPDAHQDDQTIAWVRDVMRVSRVWRRETDGGQDLIIQSAEWSAVTVKPGWWVILGASGEFRTCERAAFESNYEPFPETPVLSVSLEAANA